MTHALHQPPPLGECALARIARTPVPARAELAPGAPPHRAPDYLWTDHLTDDFFVHDGFALACPPVELLAFPQVELRSDWMPYVDGAVVVDERLFPSYARQFYSDGHIDLFGYPKVSRTRRVDAPTYVVSHFNMRTYGHFLTEILPKILLIEQLYELGLRYRVAFPRSLPHYLGIIRAAAPSVRLLLYDDRNEALSIRHALLPSHMNSPAGGLHDLFTANLKRMTFRLAHGPHTARRIFLSRRGVQSFRTLANELELQRIAVAHGYEVVSPEALGWADQVRLFHAASHVVGEFTSALHNTLFCAAGARVVSLNWCAPLQSAIASAMGHSVGYMLPVGGVSTAFEPGWTQTKYFEIDPALFEDRLRQIA